MDDVLLHCRFCCAVQQKHGTESAANAMNAFAVAAIATNLAGWLRRGAEDAEAGIKLCSGAGRSLGGRAYRWPWTPACAGVRHSPPHTVILNMAQENRLDPPRRHTRVAPCLTRGLAHFRSVWPPLLAGYDRTLRVSHAGILPNGKVREKPSPVSSMGRRERGGRRRKSPEQIPHLPRNRTETEPIIGFHTTPSALGLSLSKPCPTAASPRVSVQKRVRN